MLTVEQAQKKILLLQQHNPITEVSLEKALNQVLASNIVASLNLPPFSSSAMDGYALYFQDTKQASKKNPITLKVVDDIWAGKQPVIPIQRGECVRMMTGAMVPSGLNAVIRQEDVESSCEDITIQNPVKERENLRLKGEELQMGDCALKKGHLIQSATLGFLASLGLTKIPVIQKPKVILMATGSELVSRGKTLEKGQIYESNSVALLAALQEISIEAQVMGPFPDEKNILFHAISKALLKCTHLIVCGGVSIGDYDLNKGILADCQVEPHFWKVAQKPGKPLFFGTRDKSLVFGVPGNPVSSLVCFHQYIRPALLKSMGYPSDCLFLKEETAFLKHNVSLKKSDKIHFERAQAFYEEGKLFVSIHKNQDSHMMKSFSESNGFVRIKPGQEMKKGDAVTLQWLPGPHSKEIL